MSPVLGYWDIRGLAEPIRYLLSYKGVDYEDKRYQFTETDWTDDKYNLGLDFPNLPYYIDGDIRITQSLAIMRYLAKKYKLDGSDDDTLRIYLAEQQIVDFRLSLINLCYNPNFEKMKGDFIKGLPIQMKLWESFLADGKFLVGDQLTYVDFIAYDTFDFYLMFCSSCLDEFPKLKQYVRMIRDLPELDKHFDSPTFKVWPIFSPRAIYGGSGSPP